MTAPQGPYSADLNSGGAQQPPIPPGASYQSALPQGVPYQYGLAAPGAPVQQGARPGVFASRRARVCARVLLCLQFCFILNRFIPWDFSYLELYYIALVNWTTWFWTVFNVVMIVLAATFLARHGSAARYTLAGCLLVETFVLAPVIQSFLGGDWYTGFLPPQFDYVASSLYWRAMVVWVLSWIGVVCAICLAVPDGCPSAAMPAYGAMAPYGSPGGQFPQHAQGGYPVSAQGLGQSPGGAQGFQSPGGGQYAGGPQSSGAQGFQSPGSGQHPPRTSQGPQE